MNDISRVVTTTQLYKDYNKPLQGSLLTNQDSMESRRFFFVAHLSSKKYPATVLPGKEPRLESEGFPTNPEFFWEGGCQKSGRKTPGMVLKNPVNK